MHHGCVRSRQRRREGAAGWWPTSPSSRWGGRSTTPASWPPTTKQYLSGHGESPGRWYGAGATTPRAAGRSIAGRVPGHVRGPRPHDWGAARPPAWPQRRARLRRGPAADQERLDPLRPGRPGHRPGGAGRPSRRAGRGGRLPGRAPGGPPRPRRCPARVRTGGAGGRVRPPDVQGGRPAAAHPSGHRQPRPGAGRTLDGLGRPGPVPASAGRGRHLPGHLPARAVRTLGVEWTAADTHGNRELQGMPEDLVRGFSKRTGQIDAELDRLGADGRERTPRLVKWAVQATRKPKAARDPGHPVRTLAGGGGRARTRRGHPGPGR